MTFSKKYDEMMEDYANGKYGDEVLSLAELLKRSGNDNLFKEATVKELEAYRDKANGTFAKMAWEQAIKGAKRE